MNKIVSMLAMLMLLTGCMTDTWKAQKMFEKGRYSDVIKFYPDLPIAEKARVKLREAFVADSLAIEAAMAERERIRALREQYEREFPKQLTYLRTVTKRLYDRNERIAVLSFQELYLHSLTMTFHTLAVEESRKVEQGLDSSKAIWQKVSFPTPYSRSHEQILQAYERLNVIESMVCLTYQTFNPTALQNRGFDNLVSFSATGITNTKRELLSFQSELDRVELLFNDEKQYSN